MGPNTEHQPFEGLLKVLFGIVIKKYMIWKKILLFPSCNKENINSYFKIIFLSPKIS